MDLYFKHFNNVNFQHYILLYTLTSLTELALHVCVFTHHPDDDLLKSKYVVGTQESNIIY